MPSGSCDGSCSCALSTRLSAGSDPLRCLCRFTRLAGGVRPQARRVPARRVQVPRLNVRTQAHVLETHAGARVPSGSCDGSCSCALSTRLSAGSDPLRCLCRFTRLAGGVRPQARRVPARRVQVPRLNAQTHAHVLETLAGARVPSGSCDGSCSCARPRVYARGQTPCDVCADSLGSPAGSDPRHAGSRLAGFRCRAYTCGPSARARDSRRSLAQAARRSSAAASSTAAARASTHTGSSAGPASRRGSRRRHRGHGPR